MAHVPPDMDMLPPGPDDTDRCEGYSYSYPQVGGTHQDIQIQHSSYSASYTTSQNSAPYQVFVLNPDGGANCVTPSSQTDPVSSVSPERASQLAGRQASLCSAYILALGLGMFGAHHFYLGRPRFGIVYLCTVGLCGVGYIIDWFRVPSMVNNYNRKIAKAERESYPADRSVCDAYLLWFPFGIIGFHHYYLRQWTWAIAYTFTLGLFGIGWLTDVVRIPFMVSKCNSKLKIRRSAEALRGFQGIRLCGAYLMAVPPLGLFGVHHYYLGRLTWGLVYTFTLGLCGFGWLTDLCRMTFLVQRSNEARKAFYENTKVPTKKYLDDAYVLHIPFGLFGFHHFYLERYNWALLYAFTFGCFGVGWICDFFRMPSLVKEANLRILNREDMDQRVQVQMNASGPAHGARVVIIAPGYQEPVYNPTASATWPPHAPYGYGPSNGAVSSPGGQVAAHEHFDEPPPYDSVVNNTQYSAGSSATGPNTSEHVTTKMGQSNQAFSMDDEDVIQNSINEGRDANEG